MTPPTVNAYYSPQLAEIVFPAGILQPPFFDRQRGRCRELRRIGAVIGHELSHGFDDQGRKFDGEGNLTDWWTEADAQGVRGARGVHRRSVLRLLAGERSEDRQARVLNGKLTLGENIGDNGGVRIAFMALLNTLDGQGRARPSTASRPSSASSSASRRCGARTRPTRTRCSASSPTRTRRAASA